MSTLRVSVCVLAVSSLLFACRPSGEVQGTDQAHTGAVASPGYAVGYVPWGLDEFEFFSLTKPQLQTKFAGQAEFRNDMTRVLLSPQKGGCAGYDGPTFALTFKQGKVAAVQRIFVGCKETQCGPVLDSKEAALKYAIAGLSKVETLSPGDQSKLQTARAELADLQKHATTQ